MDPVSHAIIGTALSKFLGSGVDLSTSANLAVVIGSVFPDVDVALKKWGDYVYLKNHRVITHSFLGLLISAGFISSVLKLLIPGSNLLGVFLLAFAGGLSHTVFDILNSYGAKLLWPFYNKKMALNLLVIFDPVLIVILAGYILSGGITGWLFLTATVFYILLRAFTRFLVIRELKNKYRQTDDISVIPSMLGLFRWHFVIEKGKYTFIGEKNIINGKISIIEKLEKMPEHKLETVLKTPVGEFFSDFTPLFHVSMEADGNTRRYIFTDLRYYVKDDFFHHAVLEIDENGSIIKSNFNPYTMDRFSIIPIQEKRTLKRNVISQILKQS